MRKYIRKLVQKFGYDIVKFRPAFITGKTDRLGLEKEYKWLINYSFKTIIDIGSNEGQFAEKIRILFPNAKIYAFEPLPQTFLRLKENFQNDKKFVAFNFGLGDKKAVLEFQQNEYTPSSSFLKISNQLSQNFEEASNAIPVTVAIETLDSVFQDKDLEFPLLIKIDVQGYEDKVIQGGISTIQKSSMVISELSFVSLYDNQPLFDEIFDLFRENNFKYIGCIEQLRSPENNQILQADGIFVKV